MTNSQYSSKQSHPFSLSRRMLLGAGIGLFIISLFVFPGEPNPEWGKLWMIRPLLVVPMAGSLAGLCNYYLVHYHKQIGIHKIIAVILSVLIYIISIWMGIVLGLDGTMWD